MVDLPPCSMQIAEYYQVPISIIVAVARQEGGGVGVVSPPNRNGTRDLGIMQINEIWWDDRNPINLAERGITKEGVLNNACLNIGMGAWILRQNYVRFDGDWVKAVAAYNAGPNNWEAGMDYAKGVSQHLMEYQYQLTTR